jgi:hypothetical protein
MKSAKMTDQFLRLTQLTGDYSEKDLEALKEILEMDFRGRIIQSADEEGYILVAFTFPRYGQPDRARDGQRYVFVSRADVKLR